MLCFRYLLCNVNNVVYLCVSHFPPFSHFCDALLFRHYRLVVLSLGISELSKVKKQNKNIYKNKVGECKRKQDRPKRNDGRKKESKIKYYIILLVNDLD